MASGLCRQMPALGDYEQKRSRCRETVVFFSSRRRHTRLQGDWSSDVCSSDLFVALDVDDDVVAIQAQQFAGLGQAVAAAGVVAAGEHGRNAMRGAGGDDAFVIRDRKSVV